MRIGKWWKLPVLGLVLVAAYGAGRVHGGDVAAVSEALIEFRLTSKVGFDDDRLVVTPEGELQPTFGADQQLSEEELAHLAKLIAHIDWRRMPARFTGLRDQPGLRFTSLRPDICADFARPGRPVALGDDTGAVYEITFGDKVVSLSDRGLIDASLVPLFCELRSLWFTSSIIFN